MARFGFTSATGSGHLGLSRSSKSGLMLLVLFCFAFFFAFLHGYFCDENFAHCLNDVDIFRALPPTHFGMTGCTHTKGAFSHSARTAPVIAPPPPPTHFGMTGCTHTK